MKAHSARVKSKNFRDIGGKPLFRWILDLLCESYVIDQVVINTDARDILEELGAGSSEKVLIRDRKPEICGDFVSMNLVLADDVDNVPSDYYFMTHTTNPLLKSETLSAMIEKFHRTHENNEADSLFTVTRHQTRFYSPDGAAINHDPNELIRTQDLPPYLEENSVGYLFTADSFKNTGARIGERPVMFETPALESVDIDEPADWFMAESLLMRVASGETLPNQ